MGKIKIKIKDTIGTRCIIQGDGQRIYDAIHTALLKDNPIVLNFEGVRQFASSFFNFAIGQLLKDIKLDSLRSLLSFEMLTGTGQMLLEQVIKNASCHTELDYQKIVDSILEKQGKQQS